jgi:membrane-associated phospholipid phosphatase
LRILINFSSSSKSIYFINLKQEKPCTLIIINDKGISIRIILTIVLLTPYVWAKSNTEKLGDLLTLGIPLTAFGNAYYQEDKEGQTQFYKAYGSNLVMTLALKYTVKEKRPDNNDKDSFPSAHTSTTINSAVFMHKRYGLTYALPLYAGAIYTGYSRLHSNRHHPKDVAAGALLGVATAWYFTTPYNNLNIAPLGNKKYKGLHISYNF